MWSEVRFKLTEEVENRLFRGDRRSPRGFRKLLAALSTQHGIGLAPQFFGYGEDGKPNPTGDTVIGMGWTRTGLRIIATGPTGCAMLADKAGAIHAALMTETEAFIPIQRLDGAHGFEFLPFPRKYFLPALAVGSSEKGSFWYQAADAVKAGSSWLVEADRKIPTTISRGLMRHAMTLLRDDDDIDGPLEELLGRSINAERPWFDTGQEFQTRLNVQLHSVASHTFIQAGGVNGRLCLKGVEFSTNADLTGPWFVGRLKNEAGGQLLRVWPQENLRSIGAGDAELAVNYIESGVDA